MISYCWLTHSIPHPLQLIHIYCACAICTYVRAQTHTRTHAHTHMTLQRGNDCGTRYKATNYAIALSVTHQPASVQVLWPTSHGNRSQCTQQMCTLRGEIPPGQEEVELVVKVADANGNKGYVQLITMATFENSHGESTVTIASNLGTQRLPYMNTACKCV